jgi:hypothetical protein
VVGRLLVVVVLRGNRRRGRKLDEGGIVVVVIVASSPPSPPAIPRSESGPRPRGPRSDLREIRTGARESSGRRAAKFGNCVIVPTGRHGAVR